MNAEQALKHNSKVDEKIKALRGESVYQYKVKIVERLGDRRQVAEEFLTSFVKESSLKGLYKEYRKSYPDDKAYLIIIEPVETVRRRISVRLPVRDDSEREPAGKDPDGVDKKDFNDTMEAL